MGRRKRYPRPPREDVAEKPSPEEVVGEGEVKEESKVEVVKKVAPVTPPPQVEKPKVDPKAPTIAHEGQRFICLRDCGHRMLTYRKGAPLTAVEGEVVPFHFASVETIQAQKVAKEIEDAKKLVSAPTLPSDVTGRVAF